MDGESYSEANAGNYGHVKELLKNDDVGQGTEGTGQALKRQLFWGSCHSSHTAKLTVYHIQPWPAHGHLGTGH